LLHQHYPASSLLQAPPSPHRARTCPSPASGLVSCSTPWCSFPCCCNFPLICVLSSLPRRTLRVHLALTSAKNGSLPQKNGGSAPHFPFRGLLDVHCTLRPAYSLSRLMPPFYIGGLAPAAFAPTPVPSVRSLASRTSARAWPHSSLVPSASCKLVYLRLLRLLPAGAKVGRVGLAPTGKSRLSTARVFQQNRPERAIRVSPKRTLGRQPKSASNAKIEG
jgi:hypothetical protein